LNSLPDIQACVPDYPINLTRVGVTGVKKLVKVERGGDERPIVLISSFEVFVDLPSDRKGANLSRNFEVIDEVLEEAINRPVYEIEELCGEIAKRLLSRHEYASRAEVKMKSEYIVRRQTPFTKVTCQEVVDIFARLGVSPKDVEDFAQRLPVATHNQRGRGSISIEVCNRRCVSIDRIIRIIEESMSSKVYGLLKRPDEAVVVARAHSNPKFVEDCVRTMAQKVVEVFVDLPDDAAVTLKQINEESIHQHNAFAERVATMGELRAELASIGQG
jgi:GTP cyclohydrolase-4